MRTGSFESERGLSRLNIIIVLTISCLVAASLAYSIYTTTHASPDPASFLGRPIIANNLNNIFGNFSHIEFSVTIAEPFQNTSFSGSYNFSGSLMNSSLLSNGERVAFANISQWSYSPSLMERNYSSSIISFAQNGTIISAKINGANVTQLAAYGVAFLFDSAFNIGSKGISGVLENSTIFPSMTLYDTSSQKFGNLQLQIESYKGTNIALDHSNFNEVEISAGKLPHSNFSIATSILYQSNSIGTNISYKLVSATQAPSTQ